jgi:tetratricopeptide (TPR) repeat protein
MLEKVKSPDLKVRCSKCGAGSQKNILTGWIGKSSVCRCSCDETESQVPEKAPAPVEEKEELADRPALGERYEILSKIGKGGMGSVYKVKDHSINAILAIKVLQQELIQDAAALKRFEQEADSASNLNHPNLVSVFGHGTTDDGAPYIVMDFLDGKSLADILAVQKVLEPRRALKIAMDIAEGLAYAHNSGVIHRDIKPTNIIITNPGESSERAHIVDFGIAKVLPTANRETHDLTQTGEIFGSPNYMSPEQCLGFMLDNRSDIYSLGCLMYEILTGAPPFDGANPIQVIVKHMNEQPAEFPKSVRSDKSVEKWENVVLRCLDKEKTERYQNAEELLKDLNAIAAGKQINKYNRAGAAKPMFTKKQTLGSLVVFTGLTIYGTITAMMFNSEIGGRVLGLLISLVCLSGVYVFYSTAFELFRKRVKGLTESLTWQIALLVCLGTGCLTALQYPGMILMGYNNFPTGPFWYDLSFYNGLLHVFSLAGSLIIGICWLIFRRPNKVNPLIMTVKLVMITSLVAAFCRFGIPNQSAKVLSLLGNSCITSQPRIARDLFDLAVQMDKENSEYYVRLSELNHQLNMHDEEFKALERLMQTTPYQFWRVAQTAETYNQHKQHKRALELFNQAVADARSRDSSELSEMLKQRGEFYRSQNDLANASRDLTEALRLTPRSVPHLRLLAQINCDLGKFKEAADLLDRALMIGGSDNLNDTVLLGIIYDNLGNHAEALKRFAEAVSSSRANGSGSAIGYAYKQLGRTFYDAISKGQMQNLLKDLGLNKSLLKTNW